MPQPFVCFGCWLLQQHERKGQIGELARFCYFHLKYSLESYRTPEAVEDWFLRCVQSTGELDFALCLRRAEKAWWSIYGTF